VLSPQDPSALASFISELYDPKSADYHHFLATGQFGPEFGATQSTIQGVSSALSSLGLTPGPVASNDLMIPVSTTVAKADAAFGVQINSYRLPGGQAAYSNTSAPEVPASIGGDIIDILGLSDVVQATSSSGQMPTNSTAAAPSAAPLPESAGSCTLQSTDGDTATQLADAYGFDTGAYAAGRNGAGETIALVEQQPFAASDVANYEECNGITTTVNTIAVEDFPVTSTGGYEATNDIEDVAGLAPDATIDVYEGYYLPDIYAQIAKDNVAQVVSSSWGLCENENLGTGSDPHSYFDSEELIFEQMAPRVRRCSSPPATQDLRIAMTGTGGKTRPMTRTSSTFKIPPMIRMSRAWVGPSSPHPVVRLPMKRSGMTH
jgi:subtilase family serine protease